MLTRTVAAAILLVGLGAAVRGDDKPLDRTDLDRRAVKAVYESALLGTEIFNKGKHEECFRLYQGTLMALQPLLDHRPKLAASVKAKMEKAYNMPAVEGAFVLRDALDEITYDIAPGTKKAGPKVEPKQTTLWERLGGEAVVSKVVHDWVLNAAKDPKVNFFRGKKYDDKAVAAIEKGIVAMICELTGGPPEYKGKDMKTVHAGMKITSEEFDAAAAQLTKSLEKFKVAKEDIDELMNKLKNTKTQIVEGKGN